MWDDIENNKTNETNNGNEFIFSQDSDYLGEEEKKTEKTEKKKEKKSPGKWAKLIPTAIAFGAIAGGVFTGISFAGNAAIRSADGGNSYQAQIATAIPTSDQNGNETATSGNLDVTAIANTILPAMVELNGSATMSQQTMFGPQQYEAQSSGTGIIVGKNEEELLILTNAHVVEEMDDLQCKFVNDKSVSASIKGSSSADDVAVVAVKLSDMDEETTGAIAIAQLDDSNSEVVGQQVVAIGNALGDGQSVTVGYISALDRSIAIDGVTYKGLIMTDAAINSGNSGGALINTEGKVIGINFAKDGSYGVENMAYSIPISKVKDLIDSLMTQETRDKVAEEEAGYLGISGIDITSDLHSRYGYPQGVMIRTVDEGSAAQKAGLDSYDIITSFDGKSVTTLSGLQGIMKYYKKGETVDISYYHLENNEYVQKTTEATLDAAK